MSVIALQTGWARRVPYHPQAEAAECGLACLAMIAGYHGMEIDTAAMRRRFNVGLRGMTLAQIMSLAERLGLKPRALELTLEEMPELACPAILHWNMEHFVVLESIRGRRAIIVDPATGRREVPKEEVSRCFTGYALELSPTEGFQPAGDEAADYRSVLAGLVKLRGLGRSLALLFLMSLGLQGLVLLSPFYAQIVIDQAVPSADQDLLLIMLVGFALLLGLQAATGLVRSWVVMATSQRVNVAWGSQIFSHLIQLPLSFFERRRVGDILTRFGSVHTIQRAVTSTVVEAALDGTLAILTVCMLFIYSKGLALVVLGSVALYAILRYSTQGHLRQAHEDVVQHSARQQSHFLETLRGMQAIKLFGNEAGRRVRWQNLQVEVANASMRGNRTGMLVATGGVLIFGAQHLLVVWHAAHQVIDTSFSVGMLFAFLAYRDQFTARASGLIDRLSELSMLKVELRRLADITQTEPEVSADSDPNEAHGTPDIELINVSFAYSDADPPVLRDVSLTIPAGSSIALIGPSGCGKTTLAKLLLGIHTPTSGEIRFNGVPLTRQSAPRLRKMVASVMQDDSLFAGSVADNIACFAPEIDMARVREAARTACVDEDIQRMPMGYQTVLTEAGGAISGGQKQRLLLARAIYRKPKVLLLDEATSHLDIERERQVNRGIAGMPTTRIIIAHRPETIRSASRVVELAGGRVVRDLAAPDEAAAS